MGKFYEPLKNSKGKTDTLDKHMIYIVMDEQSMSARMSRVRGFKRLDQVEYMHLVTLNGLKVPDRKKEVYGGTNQGNVIGPVCMRPLEDGWTTTFAEKKLIFGKHRRAVGGTDPAAVGNEKPPSVNSGGASKDRNDDNIEPVFYRALPPSFFNCLFASMSVKAVVDTTAGDGSAALAALRLKKMYVGFTLTEAGPYTVNSICVLPRHVTIHYSSRNACGVGSPGSHHTLERLLGHGSLG